MSSTLAPSQDAPRPESVRPRTRFVVTADICPQALLRVLGLMAQLSLVPLAVSAMRMQYGQRFEIELDDLPDHAAEILLAKIEQIVTVRSAGMKRED